jgi:hypothetical protein
MCVWLAGSVRLVVRGRACGAFACNAYADMRVRRIWFVCKRFEHACACGLHADVHVLARVIATTCACPSVCGCVCESHK